MYLHSLKALYNNFFSGETAQAKGEREASALTALLPRVHRDSGQRILYLNGRFVWQACDANYDIGDTADAARKVIITLVYPHIDEQ